MREDRLLRRIHPDQFVVTPDGRRPSSAALEASTSDDAVSVYLASVLREDLGLDPAAVLDGYDRHGLMSLSVEAATQIGYQVVRDPLPTPPAANPAHALLVGLPHSRKDRKRWARRLIEHGQTQVIVDPRPA